MKTRTSCSRSPPWPLRPSIRAQLTLRALAHRPLHLRAAAADQLVPPRPSLTPRALPTTGTGGRAGTRRSRPSHRTRATLHRHRPAVGTRQARCPFRRPHLHQRAHLPRHRQHSHISHLSLRRLSPPPRSRTPARCGPRSAFPTLHTASRAHRAAARFPGRTARSASRYRQGVSSRA